MEWAIEVATSSSLPVAATMCIGPEGDMHGVSAGDCAVRMAKAGTSSRLTRRSLVVFNVGSENHHLVYRAVSPSCRPISRYHTLSAVVLNFSRTPTIFVIFFEIAYMTFSCNLICLSVRLSSVCSFTKHSYFFVCLCTSSTNHRCNGEAKIVFHFWTMGVVQKRSEVTPKRNNGMSGFKTAPKYQNINAWLPLENMGDVVFLCMTGAQIVGTNCHFDAETTLKAIKLMKEALEREGYNNTYLMTQPLAYWTKDCNKQGFIDLPEFPFGRSARRIFYSEISDKCR